MILGTVKVGTVKGGLDIWAAFTFASGLSR